MEEKTVIALNREKGAPALYSQIEQILKLRIENGEFQNGDTFLTEKQLQELFSVSRITVRQAVNALVNEGYLQCARGIGTTVVFRKIDENLKQVISFSEEMKLHGITMETSHCSMKLVKPDKKVQQMLETSAGEKVYRLERVRCAGGFPIVYSNTYLKAGMKLSLRNEEYTKSLYELLDRKYGVKIVKGTDVLEAVSATQAIADFLETEKNSPLFRRSRRTFDQNGEIVEYSVCYYPGDRYKYSVDL